MSALATVIYRGVQRLPALDPADRGLAYGDGLFETVRVYAGQAVWWPAHLQRLARGAEALGIPMPAQAWLQSCIDELLQTAADDAVLKLVLTRGAGGRGYAAGALAPTLLLSLHAAPEPPVAPLALRWCETRMAIQPALAGLKHLNRLEQVLARREWNDPAIHEGLMLDTDGQVACATAANVFALVQGRWLTPPVDRRGVAGVARAWILANVADAGEAMFTRDSLESADSLFLCNAVRGILPVGSLGGKQWAPHAALAELQRHLGRSEPAFATRR
jgi:4-amino-4-deoxychorismate lyase